MTAQWLNSIGRFTQKNSTTILSGVAVGGVIATVVLAVKATPEAMRRLEQEERIANTKAEPGETIELTHKQEVQICWKLYVPAALSGAATIACIIGANAIGARRNAALVAAYTIVDSAFREYKDHVLEEIGASKERKIRDNIAKDRIEKTPPEKSQVIITTGGDQLCYDTLTGRYFRSDIERIRRAENSVNHDIIANMWAPHNDFYSLIGLADVLVGDELGWNMDHLMELVFSSHLTEDGVPCLAIGYKNLPVSKYANVF